MPTYEYRCTKGHTFELFHSIRDDKPKRCPKCGARAKRVPARGAGLLFKGSGFYITDYRSKSYKEKASAEKSSEAGTSGGSDKPASSSGPGPGSGSGSGPGASSGGASGKSESGTKPREGGASHKPESGSKPSEGGAKKSGRRDHGTPGKSGG